MLKLSPPDRFDFSKPLDWPDWKQNFLRFRLATKLHKEDGDMQVSALIYTMGREAEHVYKSFTLEEGDEAKFDMILAKFDGHFVPKRNTIHEQAWFYQRNQKQGESVHLYEAFMNWRNTATLGQFVISRYETGLSSEFRIKLCRRNCS